MKQNKRQNSTLVMETDYGAVEITHEMIDAYLAKFGQKRKGRYTKTSRNLADFELMKHCAIIAKYRMEQSL